MQSNSLRVRHLSSGMILLAASMNVWAGYNEGVNAYLKNPKVREK